MLYSPIYCAVWVLGNMPPGSHALGSTLVPEPVITAVDLTKKYKDFAAVDGISFEVAPGESFGLLGPNGAGKSTTMRMVGAVSTRSGGDLRVLGLDPDQYGPEIRSQLGVVPQQDNLDTELRVRDNLIVYGRYFGMSSKSRRQRRPTSCSSSRSSPTRPRPRSTTSPAA